MATLYFTGLETGDGSELNGSLPAGLTVQGTTKYTGGYALKSSGATFNLLQLNQTAFNTAQVYMRSHAYIDKLGTSVGGDSALTVGVYDTAGELIAYLSQRQPADGRTAWVLWNQIGAVGSSEYFFTPNVWQLTELKVVVSATVGIVELRIDDAVVLTLSSQNTGTTNIGAVKVGTSNIGGGFGTSGIADCYFDDILISDAGYPGNGRCIARQGKAGAPNANSWTKNGDTTSALCWSETPFSATKNCLSATNTAQTMLVDDVGAGVDAIGASDVINACQVVGIGKFNGTASALSFYRVRRRLAAANTDEDITGFVTSTTDAVFSSSIFTDTRTNLQSAEIGGVVGTGGGTRKQVQFEDMWLMVDYTPRRSPPPVPRTLRPFVRSRR